MGNVFESQLSHKLGNFTAPSSQFCIILTCGKFFMVLLHVSLMHTSLPLVVPVADIHYKTDLKLPMPWCHSTNSLPLVMPDDITELGQH